MEKMVVGFWSTVGPVGGTSSNVVSKYTFFHIRTNRSIPSMGAVGKLDTVSGEISDRFADRYPISPPVRKLVTVLQNGI